MAGADHSRVLDESPNPAPVPAPIVFLRYSTGTRLPRKHTAILRAHILVHILYLTCTYIHRIVFDRAQLLWRFTDPMHGGIRHD
jgi:hypothetical protein